MPPVGLADGAPFDRPFFPGEVLAHPPGTGAWAVVVGCLDAGPVAAAAVGGGHAEQAGLVQGRVGCSRGERGERWNLPCFCR